ncbi:uncharacterized protein [Dermacentor albipictus]|uniref:uncharacterized protein isoform X4 n=1 Tax=Dermacentor albipictus TaxID=60249 RepID=UPI0031FCF89B
MADVRHPQPVTLPDQVANDKSKVFTVALRKAPGGGLGLGILKDCGGSAETGSVRVHELYPGQPAQLCGRLRTGDVILKVNGVRLLGKSTAQALEILRAASGLVTLTVYREQSEQNSDLSASRDQLNHCRRAVDSEIAPKDGGYDPPCTTRIPRPSSSSHDSSELSDSTPLPPKSPPLDAKQQPLCPLPRPRLRNKGQTERQDVTATRDLAGHCDFDVVTDGSVFGDLYNGTYREEKPSRDDADEPAVGAAHCRRHKSVGALAVAARSSDNRSSALDDDLLNGLARHGSTAAVRSCFNSVMLAGGFGDDDDDIGLTRWRDSVLTEESDDSGVPHCSRALTTEAGEAKLIDASSLEVNGCDFIGCCAKDTVDYIRKCGGTLQLLFVRVHKLDFAPDQQ